MLARLGAAGLAVCATVPEREQAMKRLARWSVVPLSNKPFTPDASFCGFKVLKNAQSTRRSSILKMPVTQ